MYRRSLDLSCFCRASASAIVKMLPGAKRISQQELRVRGEDKTRRFWPCPVCGRSWSRISIQEHVNRCIDASSSSAHQQLSLISVTDFNCLGMHTTCTSSSHVSSSQQFRTPSPSKDFYRNSAKTCSSPSHVEQLPGASMACTVEDRNCKRSKFSHCQCLEDTTSKLNAVGSPKPANRTPDFLRGLSIPDKSIVESGLEEQGEARNQLEEQGEARNQLAHSCLDICGDSTELRVRCISHSSLGEKFEQVTSNVMQKVSPRRFRPEQVILPRVDVLGRLTDSKGSGNQGHLEALRDVKKHFVERPPPGFKIFQNQVKSQAQLSMMGKFPLSSMLQRKPAVTVLQSGMVLFRNWLDLETQQKFVNESQNAAHLFHRPKTAGGGKYHIYSMCWGTEWDAKTRLYLSRQSEQSIPTWMLGVAQRLWSDAQMHTSVSPPDLTFIPNVTLVNLYPIKAVELGVIGLGGHQDLDDSRVMPVVSVSVGDSMTFFYRRLPPLSRRKSGVSVSVDDAAAKKCEDGDVSHNREYNIVLHSGDVLVFGGESRLIYHGTRNVQSGTRPPGLHMIPGRLNFTFRQTSDSVKSQIVGL